MPWQIYISEFHVGTRSTTYACCMQSANADAPPTTRGQLLERNKTHHRTSGLSLETDDRSTASSEKVITDSINFAV